MTTAQRYYDAIGLHVPTVLLPGPNIDLSAWAVVACDQYTSQPEYWETVERLVGGNPSSLRLVLPEVYLDSPHREKLIEKINRTMRDYVAQGVLVEQPPGFVLVDRKDSRGMSRRGLIAAIDLEHYDYTADAQTLIRATEGTIIERLPPRIQVRKKACLEIPHIMVLIDDPDCTVIEPLLARKLPRLYDTALMLGGGHVAGYGVHDPTLIRGVADALARLVGKAAASGKKPLLYAIGDGNHSLAAAKALWENMKNASSGQVPERHPARYALVELVNIHQQELAFEPIHRVLFNTRVPTVTKAMQDFYRRQGSGFMVVPCAAPDAVSRELRNARQDGRQTIGFVGEGACGLLTIMNPRYAIAVETLQVFLDDFLRAQPDTRIDYIHGDDALIRLGSQPGNIGFFLPAIDKHALFTTIVLDGALPRKTFSMGEADDKRFYLECRKIIS